jgi:hypothetical protein
MSQPLVTVLIPHYKTLDLIKLCLHLLSKYTDLDKISIIVTDNYSNDESLNYLRNIKGITLLERAAFADDTPVLAHARALDMALALVTTPYVLSIHTDTLIKNEKWLDFLLNFIEGKPTVAGVGSWKLENKRFYQQLAKAIEWSFKLCWNLFSRKKKNKKEERYLRSHCALYRMDLIRQYNLTFSQGNITAGKVMHQKLVEAKLKMIFISPKKLGRYMEHANHATAVLNPQLGSRPKTIRQGQKRLAKIFKHYEAENLLHHKTCSTSKLLNKIKEL